MKVDIDITCSEELKKKSLFFLRLFLTTHHDNNGNSVNYPKWQSIDRNLAINFDANNFGDISLDYCLCVIDKVEPKKTDKGEVMEGIMTMDFHAASADNAYDWHIIFSDYAKKAQNDEDKYAFMCLLWMLDKKTWSEYTVKDSLRRCNRETLFYLLKALNSIARCLSGNKQNAIASICKTFNVHCQIYLPPIVTELYLRLCNDGVKMMNKNLFELIDSIFDSYNKSVITTENNPLAAVLDWFNNENELQDYSILKSVFAMLSEERRLDMVKRYFHDIRLKHTTFDPNIVSQFKDNNFDEFIRYRYCLESPSEPIILTVPLLCDSILTLYNTQGNVFQSFDGVLDLAVSHCDLTHPSIHFKFERFLPGCYDAAVRNRDFEGFIDYSTIRKIDESKLTEENLFKVICDTLSKYGRPDHYWRCQKDKDLKISNNNLKWCKECGNARKEYYTDKWIVSSKHVDILNSFLKVPLESIYKEIDINKDMLSTSNLKSYIVQMVQKNYQSAENNEFIVNSYSRNNQTYDLYLTEQFSEILRMRIFPNQEAIIGKTVDIFGFWRRGIQEREAQTLEQNEVRKRVISSLKQELKSDFIDNSYFELAFDRNLLANIIRKYYYKNPMSKVDYNKNFLELLNVGNFYCAPELSRMRNQAIDLPFFWCRGSECFRNKLELQTLEKQCNWHEYSLYHLIEILGYPKLHLTEAGYEPDKVVRQFIPMVNKVAQKFKSLKCRKCGHLLFSSYRVTGFNQQNHYACLNPSCVEYRRSVYLNFCHKCKKGLIDSRDTVQCPNEWYICPTCLSCCTNSVIEQQAQRYVLSGKAIPERIESHLNHGHNDNGEYFCPKCGNPIEDMTEHGSSYKLCRNCDKKFYTEAR